MADTVRPLFGWDSLEPAGPSDIFKSLAAWIRCVAAGGEVVSLFRTVGYGVLRRINGGTIMAKKRRFTAGFTAWVALEVLRAARTLQAIATRHQLHPN